MRVVEGDRGRGTDVRLSCTLAAGRGRSKRVCLREQIDVVSLYKGATE